MDMADITAAYYKLNSTLGNLNKTQDGVTRAFQAFGLAAARVFECRLIESDLMTKQVEDWSRVRSPSRARRRMRYGHRQNVRMITVPRTDAITIDGGRTFLVHPSVAHTIRIDLMQRQDASIERSLLLGDAP